MCCRRWIYKVGEMARKVNTVLEHSSKWHTLQYASVLSIWFTRIMPQWIVSRKDNRRFKVKEPLILSQKQNSLLINYDTNI